MDLTQVLALAIGNAAFIVPLFLWNRAESRADIRHMDAKLEGQRNLMNAIHEEMKDFHGRLERQDAEFKSHLIHSHNSKRG